MNLLRMSINMFISVNCNKTTIVIFTNRTKIDKLRPIKIKKAELCLSVNIYVISWDYPGSKLSCGFCDWTIESERQVYILCNVVEYLVNFGVYLFMVLYCMVAKVTFKFGLRTTKNIKHNKIQRIICIFITGVARTTPSMGSICSTTCEEYFISVTRSCQWNNFRNKWAFQIFFVSVRWCESYHRRDRQN